MTTGARIMAAATAGFLVIAMPGPVGVLAQDAPQPENKLQEIERSLESARSRAGRLEEEMSSIAEDQADQSQDEAEDLEAPGEPGGGGGWAHER